MAVEGKGELPTIERTEVAPWTKSPQPVRSRSVGVLNYLIFRYFLHKFIGLQNTRKLSSVLGYYLCTSHPVLHWCFISSDILARPLSRFGDAETPIHAISDPLLSYLDRLINPYVTEFVTFILRCER